MLRCPSLIKYANNWSAIMEISNASLTTLVASSSTIQCASVMYGTAGLLYYSTFTERQAFSSIFSTRTFAFLVEQ